MKGLFDHLNAIYQNQSTDYYDSLSDEEKKTYSVYMINRLISMNPDYIELVNEFQKISSVVSGRESYLFYSKIIPKRRQFNKYIKSSKKSSLSEEVVKLVAKHFMVSEAEAEGYVKLYLKSDDGIENLISLLKSYAWSDKKIKKAKIR